MGRMDMKTSEAATTIFQSWLERFEAALAARGAAAIASQFDVDGHWKDLLAFTWQHRTFSGASSIREAMAQTLEATAPHSLRQAACRTPPRLLRRSGRNILEGYFDFATAFGQGAGFVRLLIDELEGAPRIWMLLTTLQELASHPEKVGATRPSGDEFAMNELGMSWRQNRERVRAFADRDPQVLVIGAAQAGLTIAARLGRIGVDTLVVEKSKRVGDVWRERYESLTLHNEVMANHLPYMPFPETWPLWLAKDQVANFLEAYAEALEINVWTGTTFCGAEFDETSRRWTARLTGEDGSERRIRCRHIVVATGVSGSVPNVPVLPGIDEFTGDVLHSAQFRNGADFTGRDVIVVGTGNSGHDVAQDLVVKGARSVSLLQRGPTCVVSLNPTAAMIYKVYGEGYPVEDVDLLSAAVPYPILEETYRRITQKGAKLDRDLLQGLEKAGLRCYFGRDGTGFQMMFMRGEGGYYIDVGCSKMIIDGRVGVIQAEDASGFVSGGLRMKDGALHPCDAVILATGFKNMQENVRLLFGDAIADKVGPLWGFDRHHQMRNMWRRTAQPGLWFTGGSLVDSRIYSRFLALEIRAEIDGLLPTLPDLKPSP